MRRLGLLLALGLGLAGCEVGHSPGDAEAANPPKPATYGPCPDIEIEGKTYPLGDNCQFNDGELVAVHIGTGWVTAE